MALGTCVNLIASKGTKIYIGAELPTTYDAAGYDAVTWTEIGMVESVGEFGPDSSIGSYTPIGTGVACKFMGTTDNGEISLTIAKTADDGLADLLAEVGETSSLPYKVELSDGTTKGTRYMFPGLVRSAKVSIGTGDDVVKINAAIVLNGAFVEGAAT